MEYTIEGKNLELTHSKESFKETETTRPASNYLDIDNYEVKDNWLWWQKAGKMYTSTGYGKKIPTTKMLKYNNRWHRIYCCIFSNSGTCYIIVKGKEIIVS